MSSRLKVPVVPLLIGTGAGAEMRKALGTAVFSGMLGVTVFGIFFTPVFYAVLERLRQRSGSHVPKSSATDEGLKHPPGS